MNLKQYIHNHYRGGCRINAAASSVLSINLSRLRLQLTSAREKSKIFRGIQYLSIFAKYGVHLFRSVGRGCGQAVK